MINSQNNKKENLITLYPFNGQSPYLIDKFYIIGYNYLTLEKMLIEETPKPIEEEKDKEIKEPRKGAFDIEEEPSILNEITNDYSKEGLDSKTILQMIFPHKLKCYYLIEEYFNTLKRTMPTQGLIPEPNTFSKIEFCDEKLIKDTRTFFTSNPQTGKNSKKSINGIAYTFYAKFKEKKKTLNKKKYTYYIPYTFCITSEYPYFSSFSQLLKCIKNLYCQDLIYVPIEIILYNIISLSPSPLNADVLLDLSCMCQQEKVFSNLVNKNNRREGPMYMSNKIMNKKISFDDKKEEKEKKLKFPFRRLSTAVNINPSKLLNKDDIYKIEFDFLSGYPLIQYNLPKILFDNLSIEKIITIFLYMFLEKDVLFFSKDIEILTLTINAFLNLSFPLNDEKYYFIGCAISLDDLVKGDSEFGLKNYTSVIGINDLYKPNFRNKNVKIGDHLVIDLDKGDIFPGEDLKDNSVNEKNKKLTKLIEKMCRETGDDEKIKSVILYQAINKLSKRLKSIYEKTYDSSIKSIPGEFIDFNKETIYLMNIEIQESFYQFINNICLYFYENLIIKSTEGGGNNPNDMNVIFDENYKDVKIYNDEELIFLEMLKMTMKYESFVYGFLQSYNPIDLYKVSLTFTEEFLSIISRKRDEVSTYKIKFFGLIDDLYARRKLKNRYELNFMSQNFNYFKFLKAKFDRDIFERNKKRYNQDETHTVFVTSLANKNLVYQTYELDDRILLNYIHYVKNLSLSEYAKLFSSSFWISENTLNQIDINDIETIVENNCIKENILTKSDICCSNILLLFAISLKSLRYTMNCDEFLGLLFQTFTVFRKYYSILLRTIYKLCQATKEKKSGNISKTAMCYYPCINSIIGKKLVPNEDLMNMIKEFNKIDIKEFISPDNEIKEKNINNEIKLYGESLEEEDITKKNLYVTKNFNSQQFFKENTILNYVNETDLEEMLTNTKETIYPTIRFDNGIHKIESFFISQKVLLINLMKEYNKFMETMDVSKLTSKIILDACLNIFIFMRNTEEFEGMDEIKDTLKSIFYIFLNQLLILKSEKEKLFK